MQESFAKTSIEIVISFRFFQITHGGERKEYTTKIFEIRHTTTTKTVDITEVIPIMFILPGFNRSIFFFLSGGRSEICSGDCCGPPKHECFFTHLLPVFLLGTAVHLTTIPVC